MGCCCPKQTNEDDADERTRLLNTETTQIKSHFVEHSQNISQNQTASRNLHKNLSGNLTGTHNSYTTPLNFNENLLNHNISNNYNETNQMFDKILSEVIHVTTFEQRSNATNNTSINTTNGAANIININDINSTQEVPFKLKGLLEPQKHQLTLPEGVTAPLSVLAAQPPFMNDIRLISNFATEANNCINEYSFQVPQNVSFNFNPVV